MANAVKEPAVLRNRKRYSDSISVRKGDRKHLENHAGGELKNFLT